MKQELPLGSEALTPFHLNGAHVEPGALRVSGPSEKVYLEPKVMAVLVALAERPGELWTRNELLNRVWAGSPSGEEVLTRAISLLRKALAQTVAADAILVTVPKLGYRLDAEIAFAELRRPDVAATRAIRPAPATAEKSIAVLAFDDMSDTGDQSYFAEGMSEEITNALVRVPQLSVAGRTSSFSYRGQDVDVRRIGADLGVAFVLEGSVRKHGDRARITVQLIRTQDGFHQWSETYDGLLDNIFDLQDRIANAVAGELDLLLNARVQQPLAPRLTSTFAAYDLLMRARTLYRLHPDDDTFNEAEAMLREAVRLDPNFARAWIEIATLNNFAAAYNGKRTLQASFEASRKAVERAVEIAPAAPETIIWSANIRYFERDALSAFRMAKVALGLAPLNQGIVFSVGHYAACFGYQDEARPLLEEALRLDPLDGFAWHILARVCQNLRDYEAAERHAEHAIKLGDALAYDALAWNAMAMGDGEKAEQRYMQFYEAVGAQMDDGAQTRPIWEMYARACFRGNSYDAGMLRQGLLMQMADPNFEPRSSTINTAAALGMAEDVMALWDRSYASRSLIAVSMWGDFDWARQFRTHPAFPAFAEARGLAAIWREIGWPPGGQALPGTDGTEGRFRFS